MSYNKINIIFMSYSCHFRMLSWYIMITYHIIRYRRPNHWDCVVTYLIPGNNMVAQCCPLVRIHLLSNFVVHSVSFSENYRNHDFLGGQKMEEIRETRIYPVENPYLSHSNLQEKCGFLGMVPECKPCDFLTWRRGAEGFKIQKTIISVQLCNVRPPR